MDQGGEDGDASLPPAPSPEYPFDISLLLRLKLIEVDACGCGQKGQIQNWGKIAGDNYGRPME